MSAERSGGGCRKGCGSETMPGDMNASHALQHRFAFSVAGTYWIRLSGEEFWVLPLPTGDEIVMFKEARGSCKARATRPAELLVLYHNPV